jgi:four helix bundle protein
MDEPVLRRLAFQLIDAAASIGANLEESGAGQSKPDFISKQCIALKEAYESRFWLRLVSATEPALERRAQPHLAESTELICMLVASIKTAKSNPHRGQTRTAAGESH